MDAEAVCIVKYRFSFRVEVLRLTLGRVVWTVTLWVRVMGSIQPLSRMVSLAVPPTASFRVRIRISPSTSASAKGASRSIRAVLRSRLSPVVLLRTRMEAVGAPARAVFTMLAEGAVVRLGFVVTVPMVTALVTGLFQPARKIRRVALVSALAA